MLFASLTDFLAALSVHVFHNQTVHSTVTCTYLRPLFHLSRYPMPSADTFGEIFQLQSQNRTTEVTVLFLREMAF